MGIAVPSQLFGRQHLILSTMKAFAAAALVAAASAAPEAKPWLGYGAAVVPIDPHATSGELVTIGDAQVPDTTLSVKAAAFPWPDTCGSATLRLSLRPTPGTAMAVSTEDTVSDMPLSLPASTELLPLDTVCASVMP